MEDNNYVTNVKGDEIISSPLNVAFGNSYILPIILAILTAPVGSLIIIESDDQKEKNGCG